MIKLEEFGRVNSMAIFYNVSKYSCFRLTTVIIL